MTGPNLKAKSEVLDENTVKKMEDFIHALKVFQKYERERKLFATQLDEWSESVCTADNLLNSVIVKWKTSSHRSHLLRSLITFVTVMCFLFGIFHSDFMSCVVLGLTTQIVPRIATVFATQTLDEIVTINGDLKNILSYNKMISRKLIFLHNKLKSILTHPNNLKLGFTHFFYKTSVLVREKDLKLGIFNWWNVMKSRIKSVNLWNHVDGVTFAFFVWILLSFFKLQHEMGYKVCSFILGIVLSSLILEFKTFMALSEEATAYVDALQIETRKFSNWFAQTLHPFFENTLKLKVEWLDYFPPAIEETLSLNAVDSLLSLVAFITCAEEILHGILDRKKPGEILFECINRITVENNSKFEPKTKLNDMSYHQMKFKQQVSDNTATNLAQNSMHRNFESNHLSKHNTATAREMVPHYNPPYVTATKYKSINANRVHSNSEVKGNATSNSAESIPFVISHPSQRVLIRKKRESYFNRRGSKTARTYFNSESCMKSELSSTTELQNTTPIFIEKGTRRINYNAEENKLFKHPQTKETQIVRTKDEANMLMAPSHLESVHRSSIKTDNSALKGPASILNDSFKEQNSSEMPLIHAQLTDNYPLNKDDSNVLYKTKDKLKCFRGANSIQSNEQQALSDKMHLEKQDSCCYLQSDNTEPFFINNEAFGMPDDDSVEMQIQTERSCSSDIFRNLKMIPPVADNSERSLSDECPESPHTGEPRFSKFSGPKSSSSDTYLPLDSSEDQNFQFHPTTPFTSDESQAEVNAEQMPSTFVWKSKTQNENQFSNQSNLNNEICVTPQCTNVQQNTEFPQAETIRGRFRCDNLELVFEQNPMPENFTIKFFRESDEETEEPMSQVQEDIYPLAMMNPNTDAAPGKPSIIPMNFKINPDNSLQHEKPYAAVYNREKDFKQITSQSNVPKLQDVDANIKTGCDEGFNNKQSLISSDGRPVEFDADNINFCFKPKAKSGSLHFEYRRRRDAKYILFKSKFKRLRFKSSNFVGATHLIRRQIEFPFDTDSEAY